MEMSAPVTILILLSRLATGPPVSTNGSANSWVEIYIYHAGRVQHKPCFWSLTMCADDWF